jgi:hypothetical protein
MGNPLRKALSAMHEILVRSGTGLELEASCEYILDGPRAPVHRSKRLNTRIHLRQIVQRVPVRKPAEVAAAQHFGGRQRLG